VLVSLSEQNLLDCIDYGDCHDGMMDFAFQYVRENKGIDSEASYLYMASTQKECRFNRSAVGATTSGCVDLKFGDEDVLKVAVATQGPISVAIDASQTSFLV
jgi:cathepsin L